MFVFYHFIFTGIRGREDSCQRGEMKIHSNLSNFNSRGHETVVESQILMLTGKGWNSFRQFIDMTAAQHQSIGTSIQYTLRFYDSLSLPTLTCPYWYVLPIDIWYLPNTVPLQFELKVTNICLTVWDTASTGKIKHKYTHRSTMILQTNLLIPGEARPSQHRAWRD